VRCLQRAPGGGRVRGPGGDAPPLGDVLLGMLPRQDVVPVPWRVEVADCAGRAEHRRLRREVFVGEQGLFGSADAERDDADDDPRTLVLVARAVAGTDAGRVLGGVRLAPAGQDLTDGVDVGWWAGSRLVVGAAARRSAGGVGAALVRAACAHAEAAGALRFDATVQAAAERHFARLGWVRVREVEVPGAPGVPHVLMRRPLSRVQALLDATKAPLGGLLAGLLDGPGGGAFRGDDAAPVPGSDLVAACDAVLPSMVERDPWWAGWCAALVNVNDVAAMGAEPTGLLDAVGARDASFAARVLAGLRAGAAAHGVPVLGGHTQLGVPAALSATALGRVPDGLPPVPGGGGRAGMAVTLAVDTAGGWRRGYVGRQWDSTTGRTPEHLRAATRVVARARPAAAKDVSMAGVVGTLAMLAEAGGVAAVLDVADVPRPPGAEVRAGDWLTCFPGTGFLLADDPSRDLAADALAGVDVAGLDAARCGELVAADHPLVAGSAVVLRWPDGETTAATTPGAGATGLGAAASADHHSPGETRS